MLLDAARSHISATKLLSEPIAVDLEVSVHVATSKVLQVVTYDVLYQKLC